MFCADDNLNGSVCSFFFKQLNGSCLLFSVNMRCFSISGLPKNVKIIRGEMITFYTHAVKKARKHFQEKQSIG